LWKAIFAHQPQQKSGILTIGLPLLDALGLDLGGIADPQLEIKSANNRSNQREYPVASIPTRTRIPFRFRSR